MTKKKTSKDKPLTVQQEEFCRNYFETGNAADSYRKAYNQEPNARDGWIYVEASQLLDNPKVALRLEQLQEEAQRLSLYTVKEAADNLDEARMLALQVENPSALVAAVNSKIKLFGLDKPTKLDVNNTHDISDPMKELMQQIASNGKRVGD